MSRFGNGVICSLMMSMMLCAEARTSYVIGSRGDNGCSIGQITDVFLCMAAAQEFEIILFFGVQDLADYPAGCSVDYGEDTGVLFNSNTGSARANSAPLCQAPPATPAPPPQAGSMSGDPIVSVNGLRVKFELPAGQTTLLWGNDDLEIFSKADVMSPDKQSQWFSDFILVVNGHQAAHIQRNVIKVTSKEMHGTLNTLSLTTVDEAGCSHAVLSPGSYPVGNGTVNIMVKRDGARVGPLPREVVTVKSNSISFSISAERAKKFAPNEEKALKYSHLDIILHKMSRNVKKGIFAEIWGFVPMSSKTARMMKQVTAA